MKKVFLYKVFVFILPLFIGVFGIELCARSIPNTFTYKRQWMEDHKDSIETLILGSSHMFSAIEPSLLRNAFNLANSAQNLEIDSWLLSEYIEKCPNLKNVLVNIDNMNMFMLDYESSDKIWNRAIYYNLYFDYPKHGIFSRYHYEVSCPKLLCHKVEKYITSKFRHELYGIDCDSLGRGVCYGIERQKIRDLEEKSLMGIGEKESTMPINTRITRMNTNSAYLNKMVEICKYSHIRLILVSPPYWWLYNKYANREKIECVEDIAKKLELNSNSYIEYGNFRDDVRICYDKDYFVDHHHLSDEGSRKFTTILKDTYDL